MSLEILKVRKNKTSCAAQVGSPFGVQPFIAEGTNKSRRDLNSRIEPLNRGVAVVARASRPCVSIRTGETPVPLPGSWEATVALRILANLATFASHYGRNGQSFWTYGTTRPLAWRSTVLAAVGRD